jgi:hypothetical protein
LELPTAAKAPTAELSAAAPELTAAKPALAAAKAAAADLSAAKAAAALELAAAAEAAATTDELLPERGNGVPKCEADGQGPSEPKFERHAVHDVPRVSRS